MDSPNAAPDHVVHEAFGPPVDGLQATAVIALGVISLLPAGVLATLLGALANEGRISQSGIGLTAAIEALTMAASTGLFGALAKTTHLRWWGAGASLLLTAADLTTLHLHGAPLMALRGAAGIPEGALLWISIGMVVRSLTPERWSAVLLTTLTAAQLGISALLTAYLLPKFGANGGFGLIAVGSFTGIVVSLAIPNAYAVLPRAEGEGGAPPPRGWLALAATLVFGSANGAVSIYLLPLAQQAGLSPTIGSLAVTVSLAAQVVGGTIATVMAGRIGYFVVFVASTGVWNLVWLIYGLSPSAWVFLAVTAVSGVVLLFVTPFFVPLTIEADPTRRAAVQSGAAQLLSAFVGPLLASFVVGDHDAHGVLWLGVALLLVGLAITGWLHFTSGATATSKSR